MLSISVPGQAQIMCSVALPVFARVFRNHFMFIANVLKKYIVKYFIPYTIVFVLFSLTIDLVGHFLSII